MKNLKNRFLISAVLALAVSAGAGAQGPIDVKYANGRISVIAEDRTLGEVFDAISKEARFSLKIPPSISSTRISIRMLDSEMDRAVVRLFSLVQERNYKVKYGPNGDVASIEVIKPGTRRTPGDGEELKGLNEDMPGQRIGQQRSTSRRFDPRRRVSRRYNPRRTATSGKPAGFQDQSARMPSAEEVNEAAMEGAGPTGDSEEE